MPLEPGVADTAVITLAVPSVKNFSFVVPDASAAEDHVHGAKTGVDGIGGLGDRARVDVAAGDDTANGERALVVVLMAAQHEVHAVPVEQGPVLLAQAQVGAVRVRGTDHDLVHGDDHPVDVTGGARRLQLLLQEGELPSAGELMMMSPPSWRQLSSFCSTITRTASTC